MKRASPAAARRYARALLDLATQAGDPAALREDLRSARVVLASEPRLAGLLASPALATDARKRLLGAVFAERGASALLVRLLELLAERRRMELLPAIVDAYGALWNAQRGVASAEAVSARPLAEDERRALVAALEKTTGLGIELETREDPSLLGGLLVRVAGRSYDGSVRARLRALRARLTA
jgi:F-type H+-transporting ATPase subunit delta